MTSRRGSCGPSPRIATSSTSAPQRPTNRTLHTSRQRNRYNFLLSHSFQGKPPDPSLHQKGERSLPTPTPPPAPEAKQIGWPSNTPIGQWRDQLLGTGDAGEDSLMAVRNSHCDTVIGVADGVGSWSQSGIDPALFSQALMYHACKTFLERSAASTSGAQDPQIHPRHLLSHAYRQVLEEDGVSAGSSTATILTLEAATGILRSVNLGDSGFIVLREGAGDAASPSNFIPTATADVCDLDDDLGKGKGVPGKRALPGTVYRSAPQQYYFNAPYQLCKYTKSMIDGWRKQNGGKEPEPLAESNPAMANEWSVRLRPGDIVVVASDGAWDNVWGKEWVELVKFLRRKHREHYAKTQPTPGTLDEASADDAQSDSAAAADKSTPSPNTPAEKWQEEKTLVAAIAYNALQYTLLCQFSEKKRSPFEAEAEKNGIRFPGGKIDDISIVVALVVEDTDVDDVPTSTPNATPHSRL